MADVRRSTTECPHTCQWSWGLLQLVGHSYATAVLKAGINPTIVSHRLHHASVAFTLSVHAHTPQASTGRQRTRSPLWSWAPPKGPSAIPLAKR